MKDLEELTRELLGLPLEQRAKIAEKLLESLGDPSPEEIERLWTEEALRRVAAYEAGEIEAKPADEVHAAVLRRLE